MPITRCPECATAFRCHPEQLTQARGWVRCGRCGAVFEALRHVWSPTPPAATPSTVEKPNHLSQLEPSDAWTDLASTLDVRHDADTDARTSSRLAHGSLAATVLLLVLLLPVQWLLGQRELLAAQSPLWRSVWSEGCRWLGCELNWPRQPQALRIESIHLEPDASGRYDVQMHIRNARTYPVAAPWVELSLLGLRDEVLVRRALSPSELGLDASVLALRDVDAALRLQLPEDLAPIVTGYKATLFYP